MEAAMACLVTWRKHHVLLNNAQFRSLISFAIEVACRTSNSGFEEECTARMAELDKDVFFPGRGFDIESDFPGLEEQKFWSRVFFDTARAIFERKAGNQEYSFWQAQCIHQAYGVGLLFQEAVRTEVPYWIADSLDSLEFDRVVNKKPVV